MVCVGAFFHGAFKAAPVGAWTVVMAFSSLVARCIMIIIQ
jgi:hypothetical protein